MPLTDLAIKSAKPGSKRRKLSDGGGLHVEISPRGVKTWKLSYRYGERQKTVTGGRYPSPMPLVEARSWREQMKALLREGRDPAREARVEKLAVVVAQAETFEAAAREWLRKHKSKWRPRHAQWVERRFVKDAFPVLGSVPIAEVSREDLLRLIARMEERDALEVCRKTLGLVEQVLKYAVANGRAAANSVPDVRAAMKPKPRTQHFAKMSVAKLPEFYSRVRHAPADPLTKLALRWTILTMVRTGETRFFRPEEVEGRDTPEPLWRIPASRMKMHFDHIVPLPRQAIPLLDEIETLARKNGSEWQFPQAINPEKPISENCMLYFLYDLGYKGVATVHGFRGLASTVLNEQTTPDGKRRFDADWIEMQLAHDERNDVRGAYNAAKYLAPRREMMQWWADFLEQQESFADLL